LGTVKHVETLESSSLEDGSWVTLEFKRGTNIDIAALEVKDKIEQVRNKLPEDVENIRIHRWSTGDLAVIQFRVSTHGDISKLYTIVENIIRPRIQRINGVANVDVLGIKKKELFIDLDLDRLKSHNIDTFALRRQLKINNINLSAGNLVDGSTKYIVRVIGEFKDVSEIANLPISKMGIKLSDVANVRLDFPTITSYERLNGKDTVNVKVMKTSDANMVTVARDVLNTINKFKSDAKLKDLNIHVYRDRSQPILARLKNLRNSGFLGGTLVICILFFFLRNIRSSLIITAAIPISVLCTFFIMFLLRRLTGSNITINIISISGMLLAIGMLVDPAIVVIENIFRNQQERNLSLKQAAITGSNEVSVAIIAATATTICVFVPLVFLSKSGFGIWMHDFGLSICAVLISSLFVALTLIPLAASRFLKLPRSSNSNNINNNAKSYKRSNIVKYLTKNYVNFIGLTLRYRWITAGAAILIIVLSWYLYGKLEKDVVRRGIYREIQLTVKTPRSYSIDDTKILFERLESVLQEKKDKLEIDNISSNFKREGGSLTVYLVAQDEAKKSVSTLYEKIKSLLPIIPGVKYSKKTRHGDKGGYVSIEINGRSTQILARLANDIKKMISTIPDLSNIETSLESGKDEILVTTDRERARRNELNTERIAFGISGLIGSRALSKLILKDDEIDINMQIKEEDLQNLDQLKNIEFENTENEGVALSTLVDFKGKRGPSQIWRKDRKTIVQITAQYKKKGLKRIKELLVKKLDGINLPAGYTWNLGEEFKAYEREESESRFGLILAIILIYIIMASLFESYIHPLAILITIPFAFTGVAIVFYLADLPLGGLSYLGLLLLCGMVVNNAIVLIDYVNRLRRSGMDRHSAIIKGGMDRLRPILMTSFTTILGLLPMVLPLFIPVIYGPLEGRDRVWAPVGLIVISGLITSTILTLVIMPTIYSLFDDLGKWIKQIFCY
jgi:HAE1 family hydrophobic/amphiphilic exporter-1